ncbi:MAG: hypothetical protein R6T98_08400 [Desulfatiglandales bacterium]
MLSFRNVSVRETAGPISRGNAEEGKPSMDTLLKRPTREPWPPARRELKKCRPSLGKYEFCKALRPISLLNWGKIF